MCQGISEPRSWEKKDKSTGHVCSLTSPERALRSLFMLGSPTPKAWHFSGNWFTPVHCWSQAKKGRERIFVPLPLLDQKRHWLILALKSKRRHQRVRNFGNSSNSNLHNTYQILFMETLSWGLLGHSE